MLNGILFCFLAFVGTRSDFCAIIFFMAHDFISAVILGVIEGLTEFLPVSSTGHLILANRFFFFEENFTKMFDIVIQFGAVLAVLFYFWEKLNPFGAEGINRANIEIWKKTIIGVLPALFFGALFSGFIEEKLFSPLVVSLALALGGLVLILAEKKSYISKISSVSEITYKTSFFIGLAQCLALVPGVSRAGATIIGAMFLGAARPVAAEFSFFLAVPTIFAASAYSFLKGGFGFSIGDFAVLAAGFVVSFLSALWVIPVFMRYIKNHSFEKFGYYRIILGAGVFASLFLFG